jgi:hypothetical protein
MRKMPPSLCAKNYWGEGVGQQYVHENGSCYSRYDWTSLTYIFCFGHITFSLTNRNGKSTTGGISA